MAYRNSPYLKRIKKMVGVEAVGVLMLTLVILQHPETILTGGSADPIMENNTIILETTTDADGEEKDYIKWVDFTVSYEALCKAYDWDVETHGSDAELHWIELLAYAAARTGGTFGKEALTRIDKAAKEICAGNMTIEELTADLQYYPYYKEAYTAALGGLVGEYREEHTDGDGRVTYEDRYGLKGYLPIARGFDYTHYDDFGAGRSYGYKRRHLGYYVIIVSRQWQASKIKVFTDFSDCFPVLVIGKDSINNLNNCTYLMYGGLMAIPIKCIGVIDR
ncbi:MAG: hypothetical protein J1E64_06575 [Acetatifactor sp.]|nr:hypothetical protein [Acetatifactor sp.]